MDNILYKELFESNKTIDLIWFGSIVFIGLILHRFLTRVFAKIVYKLFKNYTQDVPFDKLFQLIQQPLGLFIWVITIVLSFNHLNFPESLKLAPVSEFGLRYILKKASVLSFGICMAWTALRVVDFFGLILMARAAKTDSKTDDQLVPFLKEAIKVIVFILSVFIILGSAFDINIASLIAGLGIGGLAIALAAKESLENLMGSFTIFLDKPFMVGDQVQVEGVIGTIEKIGFRSTKIKTMDRSIVTVPNKKMVDQVLDNLSLRQHRRVKFKVGLVYGTSKSQIDAIINDISSFIEYHPNIDTGDSRVKFFEFGDSSINILVDYYIITSDYFLYLNVNEEMNFKIMESVEKHRSDFAFPTRTVHLHKKE